MHVTPSEELVARTTGYFPVKRRGGAWYNLNSLLCMCPFCATFGEFCSWTEWAICEMGAGQNLKYLPPKPRERLTVLGRYQRKTD